jgi:uncharacterized integral membrane protein
MKLSSLAVALTLALLALFAVLNWAVFIAPTTLSLGVTEVQAPLGLVMLVFTGGICALFLFYIVVQQAGMILEARRTAKELKSHREIADQAEASRFTEMRAWLDGELRRIEAQSNAATREVGARLEKLEQGLQDTLGESSRSMLAYLAEVEDKLDRLAPPARG